MLTAVRRSRFGNVARPEKRRNKALPLAVALGCAVASLSVSTPASACPPGGCPAYNGGPLLADLDVYIVYWGPNVYGPEQLLAPAFYGALIDSPVMDGLAEYDAGNNPLWLMDRGTVHPAITIQPSDKKTTLSDGDIQAELAHQIDLRVLPLITSGQINPRPLFAVHFPPGITINGPPANGTSCVPSGFCGYHQAFPYNTAAAPNGSSMEVVYTVIPDFSPASACASICVAAPFPAPFTVAASHEIMEAVTDPDPNASFGCNFSNEGWIANNFCGFNGGPEIGDPCSPQNFPLITRQGGPGEGQTFQITTHWSNKANACVGFGTEFWPFPGGGCATSIGVGTFPADGAEGNPGGIGPVPWIIGSGSSGTCGGVESVEQWSGTGWNTLAEGATYVTVSGSTPWILNKDRRIWVWNGSTFVNQWPKKCAISIGVGPVVEEPGFGGAWIIGCDSAGSGGNHIYHLVGQKWVQVAGAAIAITVSPDTGQPWIVDAQGNIFFLGFNNDDQPAFQPSTLFAPNGCADHNLGNGLTPNTSLPIAVGPHQDVWVVGCSATTGDHPIWHMVASPTVPNTLIWQQVPGAFGISLAMSPLGQPWMLNKAGQIFH